MVKTTVYIDDQVKLSLRALAQRSGRAEADLIREALRKFTADQPRPLPSGLGKFTGGGGDTAARSKEILREAARTGKWR